MKLLLTVALSLSLWATWAAWRGPPPPPKHTAPAAQPRTTPVDVLEAQKRVAADLTHQIQAAARRTGHSILAGDLEGRSADGDAHLQAPIPDNPLMPGIATIHSSCEPAEFSPQADWTYCPATGVFTANVATQSTYGKE